MTTGSILELALAVALIGAGIWYYRRPRGDSYGGQGAVMLMFVVIVSLLPWILAGLAAWWLWRRLRRLSFARPWAPAGPSEPSDPAGALSAGGAASAEAHPS